MNLFGIGSLEILIILLVAFLVLGPTRIMDMARGMGKIVGEMRNVTSQMTRIMEEEDKEGPAGPKDSEVGKEEPTRPKDSEAGP